MLSDRISCIRERERKGKGTRLTMLRQCSWRTRERGKKWRGMGTSKGENHEGEGSVSSLLMLSHRQSEERACGMKRLPLHPAWSLFTLPLASSQILEAINLESDWHRDLEDREKGRKQIIETGTYSYYAVTTAAASNLLITDWIRVVIMRGSVLFVEIKWGSRNCLVNISLQTMWECRGRIRLFKLFLSLERWERMKRCILYSTRNPNRK